MNALGTKITILFICCSLLLLSGLHSPLEAQYFGRNKVQYDTFDFKVIQTEHFDIYYYPEMAQAALEASRMAERWYARLSRLLNHELRGRQPLILYANSPDFQQTTAIPGVIGEGVGGVTEMFKRRVILPLGPSLAATDHVIGHELVHAFQFDMTSQGHSSYAGGAPTVLRLPLWMVEGMAEYLSIGANDPHTSMWMRDIVRREELPTIKQLATARYFPYRYGQSLWAYITGKWGDDAMTRIIKSAGRMGGYEAALQKNLGLTLEELAAGWHTAMQEAYAPLMEKTYKEDPNSLPLIKGDKYNVLNISPALSPDGSEVVILSTRDLFSIDMFLVDAETGKFKKKLISAASNPHFESLQFIKSAGSWDAEGKQFVFGSITKGKPALTIFDMEKRRRSKEIVFDEAGEILSPTWSPDGRYIAFSAQNRGVTDLFVYDLEMEKLERLTNDPYADLQPDWSPDGKYIAFVTERFSTDMAILDIGPKELALLEVETGEIKKLEGFENAKNINPQWSPDSKALYFISDQNGIPNIYYMKFASQDISQVTNLFTGVTGITDMSPAISVAQTTGRLAYCYYDENQYSIYTMNEPEPLDFASPPVDLGDAIPSMLPPREQPQGDVHRLLTNPLFGLPEESDYPEEEYKPKLKLDYISSPQLGVGVDRFGTYAAGGISLNFSDMMGYRNLATTFMLSSRLQDSVAVVAYQNTRTRLNWGASIQRVPYIYAGYGQAIDPLGNWINQEQIFRQVNYNAAIFAAYPLSQVHRLELWGGYRIIDYQYEIRTRVYSPTGILLDYHKQDLPAPDSLYMSYANAAMVYDSSMFGATAPIIGQSYILQFTPYFGSLNYYNILADFRKYFMPVRPFTLAFRFLHYGRYGSGANDSRLYPLFMGYETFVRGYNYTSFGVSENDVYDQLFGNKMIVGNVELRFPLFQVLGIGGGWYGVLPLDFHAFFDTGVAWFDDDSSKAWFMGGSRRPLSSYGVGLRMNLFGYFIMGLSYVNPIDRPEKGPYLLFTLFPGF